MNCLPTSFAGLLALEPNATCGFVRMPFVIQQPIAPGDCRRLSLALYE